MVTDKDDVGERSIGGEVIYGGGIGKGKVGVAKVVMRADLANLLDLCEFSLVDTCILAPLFKECPQ